MLFVGNAFAADGATLSIASATAKAGDVVSLDISLANNPGVTNIELWVTFDTNYLQLEAKPEDGGIFPDVVFGSKLNRSPYKMVFSDDADFLDYDDNGLLATMNFVVAEDAPAGDYTIGISADDCLIFNSNDEDVAFDFVEGKITVEPAGPAVPTAESIGLVTADGKSLQNVEVTNDNGSKYTINSALAFVSCVDADKATPVKTVITRADSDKELVIDAKNKTDINGKTYFVAAVSSIKDSSKGKVFTAKAYAQAGETLVEGNAATGTYAE
jgi:hypothetical protein